MQDVEASGEVVEDDGAQALEVDPSLKSQSIHL